MRESTEHKRCGVVLCGHSMGGLVSLDAALSLSMHTPSGSVPWPHILGVLAYDSPLLGVHPHVFKHQLATYHGYLDTAMKVGAILGPVTGGLASMMASQRKPRNAGMSTASWIGIGTAAAATIGTAAVAAYTRSDPMSDAYHWLSEHVTFVKHLWDQDELTRRAHTTDIPYHCFYTRLPGTDARTFILLPPAGAPTASRFSPVELPARDEIGAHVGMFSMMTNPGYPKMGLDSANLVASWLEERGTVAPAMPLPLPAADAVDNVA